MFEYDWNKVPTFHTDGWQLVSMNGWRVRLPDWSALESIEWMLQVLKVEYKRDQKKMKSSMKSELFVDMDNVKWRRRQY